MMLCWRAISPCRHSLSNDAHQTYSATHFAGASSEIARAFSTICMIAFGLAR